MNQHLKVELGPQSYVVCVLWLCGWNTSSIAYALGRTKGSIRGIVHRSLSTARDALSIKDRQQILDQLKGNRLDGGKLKDGAFIALPLDASQRVRRNIERIATPLPTEPDEHTKSPLPMRPKPTPAPPPPEPDLRTRAGRKEAVRRRKEMERAKKIEIERQQQREQGGATKRGLYGNALEYLYTMLILSDPAEKLVDALRKTNSLASRDRRNEAGKALREFIDGCRIGGVSSVDFEREVAGSGVGLAIPAYRLECISALGAIKAMMPDRDYELIEAVVDRDEFPWQDIPTSTGKVLLYEAIRRSLDVVAVFLGLMAAESFAARWGFEVKPRDTIDHDDAVSISRQARQMFSKAQREGQ